MTITRNTIGALILGSVAVVLGTYSVSLENPAQARRGDGGVAGGGTTCSTAPAAIIGNNTFDTTSATASLAVGSGGGCTANTMYKVNYFAFTPTQTGTLTLSCALACVADRNGDRIVDGADLAVLIAAWATSGADLNGDFYTDGADLAIMLGSFGPCP